MDHALWCHGYQLLAKPQVLKIFSYDPCNKSFTILCFTLKSMIYFELISVEGLRCRLRFMLLFMDIQLLYNLLLKRPSFLD